MPVASLLARLLLVSLGVLSLLLSAPQARAEDKVLRVGTLKLIHGITPYFYEKFAPPGYKIEVVPFESPTDGKNAVLTGTSTLASTALPRFCSALPRANRW